MTYDRKRILTVIDERTNYDPETVIFHTDGEVSAILDADKTFAGPHDERLNVGHIDQNGRLMPIEDDFDIEPELPERADVYLNALQTIGSDRYAKLSAEFGEGAVSDAISQVLFADEGVTPADERLKRRIGQMLAEMAPASA